MIDSLVKLCTKSIRRNWSLYKNTQGKLPLELACLFCSNCGQYHANPGLAGKCSRCHGLAVGTVYIPNFKKREHGWLEKYHIQPRQFDLLNMIVTACKSLETLIYIIQTVPVRMGINPGLRFLSWEQAKLLWRSLLHLQDYRLQHVLCSCVIDLSNIDAKIMSVGHCYYATRAPKMHHVMMIDYSRYI